MATEQRILPIQPTVIFKAYQKRGYEMSILLATNREIMPWYYSKLINCRFCPSRDVDFDFVLHDGEWFEKNGPFIMHKLRMKKDGVSSDKFDYLMLTINALDEDMYVYGKFDEFYIPHKTAYQKYHFPHSFLIYGYNQLKQEFYAIGYTDNAKYEIYSFSFEHFMEAFNALNYHDLNFVRADPEFDYSLDLSEVYSGIYDYNHSINTLSPMQPDELYGFKCVEKYMEYISQTRNTDRILDMRYSRFFTELKEFMKMRLDYLQAVGVVHEVGDYARVSQIYHLIHNLFIKFNITRNHEILTWINSHLQEAIYTEYKILDKVLEQLDIFLKDTKSRLYLE